MSASGFKEIVQNGIVLTATQQAAVNYSLDIGGESTIVEVTTEIPLVNVGNSVLGRTVDNREVDNLPIVGRNVYQLLSLTPGNQTENTIGFPGQHVIAEYGGTGAGVVSVLTKSGTNQVHGSLFEFHQETNFNSNAWLQTTRTPLHINRFGATLGGQIIKDKTFLFGSYASLRQVSPVNFNTVVPDALQRAGNFSENLPTSTTIANRLGACATPAPVCRGQVSYGLWRKVYCLRPCHASACTGQSSRSRSELSS